MQKGLLYNMLLRLGKCFFLFPLFFIACDDLEDKPSIVPESNGDVFENRNSGDVHIKRRTVQSE